MQGLASPPPADAADAYRAVFDHAAVGLARVAPDGSFIEVNDCVCQITGYAREELLGMSFQAITHPDDLGEDLANAELLLSGSQQSYGMDKRYVRKDGSTVWVRLSGSLMLTPAGEPDYFVSVISDISESKAAELELQKTERQLRRVLDQLFAFVGLLTVDGVVLHANAAPLEAAGITLDDVVGKRFEDVWWWSYDPAVQERLRQSIARAAAGELVRYDVPVRMSEGRLMHIDFQLSPMRDEDGQIIGLIPSAIDIDQRKAAEEHNQLLLAELNHRVRNSLTIVQHFARHAFRSVADPDGALPTFERRLMALGAAHTLLTQAQWEPVSLADLIERTVAAACGGADRFVIEGPLVVLPPKTAVTLSLALHELCTNAVKYGALSMDGGTVHVVWSVPELADGSRGTDFLLIWREVDGPAVTEPERSGFGTRMIERALAQEFHGEVNMGYFPSGLVCTLRGRMPSAEARPA
jgi:PAS domain S-box-containing protein